MSAWAAGLARLVAIMKQRSSYEQLYGYGGAPATEQSARSHLRSSPWLSHTLALRAGTLTERRKLEIRQRSKSGGLVSSSDGGNTVGPASGHHGHSEATA